VSGKIVSSFPRVVAHRGAATAHPENSLEAIQAALDCRVPFVEFDVQLCADRVPILMHDETLERLLGTPLNVLEQPLDILRQIDLGAGRHPGGPVRIPLLDEALALLAGYPQVQAFVELKRHSIQRFGLETCMQAVLERLAGRHIVLSFVDSVVRYARQSGHPLTGWAIRTWDEDARGTAHRLQPDYLFCNYEKVPDGDVLWSGGWDWVLYEITDPDVALAWHARGATLIESMDPGRLLADPRLAGGRFDAGA
jgi:glycerophosphoryl diester phosphodiesterase